MHVPLSLLAAAPAALAIPLNLGSFFGSWTDGASSSTGGASQGAADVSSSKSSQSTGNTHLVIVGGEQGLRFDPESVQADPGDLVFFEFRFKNHTVTQSSLSAPCTKLDGGFASGFQPVGQDVTTGFPGFVVTVTDSNPIWFYCGQKLPQPHCEQGMVGAINPKDSNQFDTFKKAAIALNATASKTSGSSSSSSSSGAHAGSYGSSGNTSSSASAPQGTTSSIPTKGWNAPPQTHLVKVGGAAGLVFDPPVTAANVGEQVIFEFSFNNHTVSQSSFDQPCSLLPQGLNSGFQPVSNTSTSENVPAFVVTVEDTKPIWFYCQQKGHCAKGMVGAINPPQSGNTFDAFKAKALASANATGSTNGSKCSTASIKPPIPAGQQNLTAPPSPIKFVTLGVGTQNYTCNGTSLTFGSNVAVAKLFDTSCLASLPIFPHVTAIAALLNASDPLRSAAYLKNQSNPPLAPADIDTVASIMAGPGFGFHEFPIVNGKATPLFDLSQGTGNKDDFILANKTGSIASPDDPKKDVAWLQLASIGGQLTNNMYRLETVNGQPPTNCSKDGEQVFQPYAASYWF